MPSSVSWLGLLRRIRSDEAEEMEDLEEILESLENGEIDLRDTVLGVTVDE
jgi:hypothetical protein